MHSQVSTMVVHMWHITWSVHFPLSIILDLLSPGMVPISQLTRLTGAVSLWRPYLFQLPSPVALD